MRIKSITTFALCATLLAACQQSEYDDAMGHADYPQDGVVRITTQVNSSTTTRAATTYSGATLGLSLAPEGSNPSYTYTNEQWSKSALGGWTSVNQLLWQSATTPYHIYAYAPYSATATDDGNITHTIAADQSQDGALLSSDLVGYTTKGTAAAEGTFISGTSLVNCMLPPTLDQCLAQLTVNRKLGTALLS